VGGSAWACSAIVRNGGRLNTGSGSGSATLGIAATATGNVVTVSGPGSLWVNQAGLNVGSLGGNNQLIVTNGGELQTLGLTVSSSSGAGNSAVVAGGILAVTNAVHGGDLDVAGGGGQGTFTFNGGTITIDQLFLTNGAASVFNFNRGVLNVYSSQVAKASAFVVGDGSSAAQLNLLGTSHSFADGLTISGNATLSGIGTIIGNVTLANLATWAPGFSAGTQTVVGAATLNPGTVLSYELDAPGGSSDLIEVSGNLTLDGTINVANLGGLASGAYPIFTYGSLTDDGLNVGSMPGGFTGTISNDVVNSRILLVVSSGAGGPDYNTWATHYGLSGGTALGAADPDGDGMSNTNEFLAGFAPNNNAAYLHVIAITKTGSDIKVTYLGANGDNSYSGGPSSRTNVLEYTTGTVNGSYSNNFVSTGQTNVLSGGNGSGVTTNMTDVGGATGTTRYYRVRVLVP
jgi:T5SS/PEP-CTERM-associated repeat protein